MIGLTGGIASGKSTVAQRLREHGGIVLDADLIAREVVQIHSPAWERIKEVFPEVILKDLTIDREHLGKIIFSDQHKRQTLEAIIHPLVRQELEREGSKQEKLGKIVFAEVPLLYEVGWQNWLQPVWVVYVPLDIQLTRLRQRAGLTTEEAIERISSQLPLESKKEKADTVIDNSGNLTETWIQVDRFWKELGKNAGKRK